MQEENFITIIKLCKLYLNLHRNSLTAEEEEFCLIRLVFQTIHTYHAFLSNNSEKKSQQTW